MNLIVKELRMRAKKLNKPSDDKDLVIEVFIYLRTHKRRRFKIALRRLLNDVKCPEWSIVTEVAIDLAREYNEFKRQSQQGTL